jgi:hypothetical protein
MTASGYEPCREAPASLAENGGQPYHVSARCVRIYRIGPGLGARR